MKKPHICITVLIVLLLIVAFCAANREYILKNIGECIVAFAESQKELPTVGTYTCQDLGLSLVFNEHELCVISSDYRTEVYVDFYGRLLWGDSVIAFYYWNQKNNVIEISFEHSPSGINEGVTYLFTQDSTNSS